MKLLCFQNCVFIGQITIHGQIRIFSDVRILQFQRTVIVQIQFFCLESAIFCLGSYRFLSRTNIAGGIHADSFCSCVACSCHIQAVEDVILGSDLDQLVCSPGTQIKDTFCDHLDEIICLHIDDACCCQRLNNDVSCLCQVDSAGSGYQSAKYGLGVIVDDDILLRFHIESAILGCFYILRL